MASTSSSARPSENVRVAVRARPLNDREKREVGDAFCIHFDENGQSVSAVNPDDAKSSLYTFDFAYDADVPQKRVYEDLGKIVLDASLEGYNGTIFAYGQTGSGKTYTMMGYEGDLGIIPLLNRELFERTQFLSMDSNTQFLISCSYLEIYNEDLHDLLNPSDSKLNIRENRSRGIFVQGLAELVVHSYNDIEQLIDQGNRVRKVHATAMNDRSSRSHSVFTINIAQKREEGDLSISLTAKINLVDLAGSERLARTKAEGQVRAEGIHINQSLSALGKVITALTTPGSKHIPYRDSQLTRLLQESLGGNSVTVMVANITLSPDSFDETKSTLGYAYRAKSIKNAQTKNEDVSQAKIRELRGIIESLQAQLEARATAEPGGPHDDENRIQELERLVEELREAKQQTWEERERTSKQFENERQQNLANKGILEIFKSINFDEKFDEEMKQVKSEIQELDDAIKMKKERVKQLRLAYEELNSLDGSGRLDEVGQSQLKQIRKQLAIDSRELKDLKENRLEKKKDEKRLLFARATAQQESFQSFLTDETKDEMMREYREQLEEERNRMRQELELEMKNVGSDNIPLVEHERVKMELIEAKTTISSLEKEVEILQEDRDRFQDALDEMELMTELRLEQQQIHQLKVFKKYREFYESSKQQLEKRYALLLEQSVADTLRLSDRVASLENELARLLPS